MPAQVLYAELLQAGVLLERAEDGRLMANNTHTLAPFLEAIQQQKDALLEIVARRDQAFYDWIASTCLLSRRVSTSLHHLWLSYECYCSTHGSPAMWVDFERLVRAEFEIVRGFAVGLSLRTDWQGYKPGVVST
jgi:hypothetical protein